MAFGTPAPQIDGPSWLTGNAYEIRAKLPDNAPVGALPDMLLAVCIDRLGLVFHRESRVRPVYSLVVAKDGPNLTVNEAPESAPSGTAGKIWTPLGQVQMVADGPGPPQMVGNGFQMTINDGKPEFQFSTVHDLIAFLSLESDRPIVDDTGLVGLYHIRVTVPMGREIPVRVDAAPLRPTQDPLDMYTASLTMMGLRLSPSKASVDTIVVDRMNASPRELAAASPRAFVFPNRVDALEARPTPGPFEAVWALPRAEPGLVWVFKLV